MREGIRNVSTLRAVENARTGLGGGIGIRRHTQAGSFGFPCKSKETQVHDDSVSNSNVTALQYLSERSRFRRPEVGRN